MMPRQPTPPDLLATVRAQTPDDAALSAMFGPAGDGERIVQIALHALDDNPFQHRTAGMDDDDPGLIELSADIKTNGIHQPLIVRPHPDDDAQHGRYQIAAGHRRRLAAHLAGEETVPCVIRPLTDDQMLDVVFAENYHRADINAIDRAQLIQLLVDQGMTQQAIAHRFSMSRPAVSNALRLLKLPKDIQAAVVAGKISNRQAEALLPLATLPKEALIRLNNYQNLPAMMERAERGDPSDSIRDHVKSAVTGATKEIPQHWAARHFGDLAGIQQPKCAGCPRSIHHADSDRCTLPSCWDLKSSAWQAIENREIVAAVGIDLMPANPKPGDYTGFYSSQQTALGLPDVATEPPTHQCPNLRIRKGWKGFEFVCYHPGKSQCECAIKGEKALKKDGNAQWKALKAQTEQALSARLASMDLDALRLLAHTYACYEQTKNVPTWSAEQCIEAATKPLVGRFAPYDPAQHIDDARKRMTELLALAGVRAPWLPPLADELSARLAALSNEIDDYQSPGDGLPTPERMAAILDQLNATLDSAKANTTGDDLLVIQHQYRIIWPAALALNERVQASHATD